VLIQLIRVTHEVEHELTSKLSYFGLSDRKYKILLSLLNHERPLNPSELADYAGVTRSTITGLLDGLEKDEFIRKSMPEDRRKTAIHVTEKGRQVVNTLTPLYGTYITNIFSKMTKEEQLLLMDLLGKIKSGLHYAKDHNVFPT
uniref:MarR family winged helix-turn-helix transcriptional regulator n=1 Tax=Ectobacillus panaciterrae TaxID=363872 RepID=UPI0006874E05